MAAYSPAGVKLFDTTSMALSYIDQFTVTGGASGSRSYPAFAGWTFYAAQVQDDPTGADFSDVNSFTALAITISYPGGIPTVSWSLAALVGTVQNVDILVMGN